MEIRKAVIKKNIMPLEEQLKYPSILNPHNLMKYGFIRAGLSMKAPCGRDDKYLVRGLRLSCSGILKWTLDLLICLFFLTGRAKFLSKFLSHHRNSFRDSRGPILMAKFNFLSHFLASTPGCVLSDGTTGTTGWCSQDPTSPIIPPDQRYNKTWAFTTRLKKILHKLDQTVEKAPRFPPFFPLLSFCLFWYRFSHGR